MTARKILGMAALAVIATLVTGFALNALAGVPLANASKPRGDHKSEVSYDSSVKQRCDVSIEMSTVDQSGVCAPEANVDQSGAAGRGADASYESDVTQTCKVHIEMTTADQSGVCKPQADVNQGGKDAKDGGHHEDAKPHDEKDKPRADDHKAKADDRKGGDDRKTDDGKGRGGDPKGSTNQEKVTCEAGALLIATNQCDVGGNANAFTEGGDGKTRKDDGRGHASAGGEERASVNQEKTTCEAGALLIATNQCDVGGNANAYTESGGGNGGAPIRGLTSGGGLLGGLLSGSILGAIFR